MKRYLSLLPLLLLGFLAFPSLAHQQVSGSLWKLQSNELNPVNSSWSLQIPGLGGSGTVTPCVTNSGDFTLSGCPASGSSTFGTTSISALFPLVWNTSTAQLSTAFGTTTTTGLVNNGLVMTGATGIFFSQATSSAINLNISGNAGTVTNGVYTTGVGSVFVNGSGTSGNCVQWGASNALTDAGAPCGSGSGGGVATTSLLASLPLTVTKTAASITFGSLFSTTTDTGIGHNLFLYTNNSGVIVGTASSSLNLPNAALANSSVTVNGTVFNLGDTHTITAASSTLLSDSNTFTGINTFSPPSNTSGFTINGTTFNVDSTNHRVGIGIATPSVPLQVGAAPGTGNGTASIALQVATGQFFVSNLKTNTYNNEFTFDSLGADYGHFYNDGTADNDIFLGGSTGLNTTPSGPTMTWNLNAGGGSVGIGTTSPYAKLSVNSVGGVSQAPSTLFAIASSTAAYATSTLFVVNSSGYVGVGTTSPTNLFSVGGTAGDTTGNGFFSGTVTANNFFDTSVGGNTCIGESGGLLGTSNCVASLASSGSTLTVSSPTGNVNVDINLNNANTWVGGQIFGNSTTTNATTTSLYASQNVVSAGQVSANNFTSTGSTLPPDGFTQSAANVLTFTTNSTANFIMSLASSTLQGALNIIGNSTSTNATSTSLFATTASTTNLFGANLQTCNTAGSSALTYTGSTGRFGCNTISAGNTWGYPFTNPTEFGTTTAATTTPIWAQEGVFASSSIYVSEANGTAGNPVNDVLTVMGGAPGNSTSGGNGANIRLTTGSGSGGSPASPGGNFYVTTGNGGNGSSVDSNGGDIKFVTGNGGTSNGNARGGDILFSLGTGGSTGGSGLVGISSTTPYKLLSIGGDVVIGASTAGGTLGNLYLPTLTSGDCVQSSTNGLLVSAAAACGAGTVTSIAAGLGLNGGTITTSGTLSLQSYISTSSAETANQIPVWTTTSGTPAQLSGGFAGYTLTASGLTATNATTTAFKVTNLTVSNLTGLSLMTSGVVSAYGGAAGCTNQFVTAISASGGTTCTSLTSGNVTTALGFTPGQGTVTGSGTSPQIAAWSGSTALSGFSGYTLTSTGLTATYASTTAMSATTGLFGTSGVSVFTPAGALGLASTSPFAEMSIATGTILVAEFKPAATSTSQQINWLNGTQQLYQEGTAGVTFTFINAAVGQKLTEVVCNPNSGTAGTLTWPAGIRWAGGTAPTQTTTANHCDVWSFLASQATSTNSGAIFYFGAATTNF